ncbi:MAG TPA: uroporphyrinogen decarboxylase family protein, partial [Desulfobacterales bacterium]|nr:uroporphyrinogen decarboxylase family protein [Desulfobacterales bacterium]
SGTVEPDVGELLDVILRRRPARRVHHVELFLDGEVKDAACTRLGIGEALDRADPLSALKRDIELHAALGHDMFRIGIAQKTVFPTATTAAADTTALVGQRREGRAWQEEHAGPIQGWKDFEAYPWPSMADLDLSGPEWLERNLPEGMGWYELTAHVFEMLSFLLGYETLCYAVVDTPDLVDAILDRVGAFYLDLTRTLADFRTAAVIWGSDDLGFRTGTMMSPDFFRKKILPWHRRCAEVAHAKGKPYLLHSCGNLDAIMDDLLDDVRIDARHSFEDVILPVTEAKRRYGARVCLLGGIDMDFLCRSGTREIRHRVRATLDACLPEGGYCLGTGNTVANYVPLDNYLAMVDEGRRYRV